VKTGADRISGRDLGDIPFNSRTAYVQHQLMDDCGGGISVPGQSMGHLLDVRLEELRGSIHSANYPDPVANDALQRRAKRDRIRDIGVIVVANRHVAAARVTDFPHLAHKS
jgi:hypothetical protein